MFINLTKHFTRRGQFITLKQCIFQHSQFSMNSGGSRSGLQKTLPSAGRGALIVFEGVDRSGKTTQAEKLVKYLEQQGTEAELWKFPDRTTTIGKMIDSYLKCNTELDNKVVHLLFSSNRWEKRETMVSKILSGTTIVLDRYSYSGVAFSAAKNDAELTMDWCKSPEVGLPSPDLVFFMQLPLDNQNSRKGFGEERYENNKFQKKVLDCFMELKDENWLIINAEKSVEDIHQQIIKETNQMIQVCNEGKSLSLLWDGRAAESQQSYKNVILELKQHQNIGQNHQIICKNINGNGSNNNNNTQSIRNNNDEMEKQSIKKQKREIQIENQTLQILQPCTAKQR
eukprot:TRINITY_DN12183_c0_g2_i1.p1 TRINITY_DN12183_c0_g2~~TRINITY_DN12183_c0_g2_i1.p1  ORF type:complete len:341 (+),score=28.78 TRINITY_DN12183_c0_g2_i1:93-1115(+)